MKILFVTRDKFPPFRPAAAAIFLSELPSRGHRIDWLAQSAVPGAASVMHLATGNAYLGASCAGGGTLSSIRRNVQGFVNYFRIFKLLRLEKYDLVQVKDLYVPAVLALLACRIHRIPFCYWLAYPHAESSLYKVVHKLTDHRAYYFFRGNFWRFLLYRLILPSADHIFVQSEQMRVDLVSEGASRDRMTAVPGSLDLGEIPYVPEVGFEAGDVIAKHLDVVYLGTLSRVRHLDFLLRAFAQVAKDVPNARLVMLGKGDEPDDDEILKQVANELDIASRILFTGFLPMDKAWEYVRNATVCVSPYYPTMILNSTSPTKLIEYMAMARAVVGNDHPEQKLVISESGGGLCVRYDESEFGAAIVQLLKNRQLAREMGWKGRAFVEKHRTNTVMADVVESRYLDISSKSLNTGN